MNKKHLTYLPFAITTFSSAFLIFQVEPMIGKYLLPHFGGSAFVWITALLFFQIFLLLGYLYSYLLTKLSTTLQTLIHSCLLLINALIFCSSLLHWSIPIMPPLIENFPSTLSPLLQVLTLLTLSIGLPFFLLASTSTLLQKWLSRTPQTTSPYSLYALSNASSLIGVIGYPLLVEPLLPLHTQGILWSFLFLAYCAFYAICTYITPGKSTREALLRPKPTTTSPKTYLLWLTLPAISSLMLLAATNQMTQAISPAPFLWLLPLSLYLISFIITFTDKPLYFPNLFAYCFLFSSFITMASLHAAFKIGFFPTTILYMILLFSSFLLCHAELYRHKPNIHQLNLFYLCLSFGSILGAIIVAIIAPIFFIGLFWEFYLALFATTLLAVWVLLHNQDILVFQIISSCINLPKQKNTLAFISVCLIFAFIFQTNYREQTNSSRGSWRNFYATLRITDTKIGNDHLLCLMNGLITHGCQYQTPPLSYQPITYYNKESGVGLAIQSLRNASPIKTKGLRVGIIGLGVGTLAAYGQKNDYLHFYDLNPQDIYIAKNYFQYLRNSPARIEITEGDGRISLEKQRSLPPYDLLVIDAFSDDAIPVHLLTKEAFALYLKHLSAHGILAVHITNSYLRLAPVVKQLANYFNLHLTLTLATKNSHGVLFSQWALLSHDAHLINTADLQQVKQPLPQTNLNLWTDDYSNLIQILKY